MTNFRDRPRKVDVNALTQEQVDQIQKQIATEMAKIMDDANVKCNAMLNIYGLQTKIHYKIVQISENTDKKPKRAKVVKKTDKVQSLNKLQE